jgi:type III pantothenate kinase
LNLVIDIGNTLTKLSVFKNTDMVYIETMGTASSIPISKVLTDFREIDKCIISSVAHIPPDLLTNLSKLNINTIILDVNTRLPFNVFYKTPDTLGKDRIAVVAGAYLLHPDQDLLVIDAGTAITYEVLTKDKEYLGGNISPGLDMRFRALNQFTAKLPLLAQHNEFSLIGKSTNEAIINGVQNGLIFEIEGTIRALKTVYTNLIVLLTGGNAGFVELNLKYDIVVVPNLTLIGLNAILETNKN